MALKLFTLLLVALLLLSFSAPAFALPIRYYLVINDLDENPHPHAMKYVSFYIVIALPSGGFMFLPIFVKSKATSENVTEIKDVKTSGSPRLDEYIQ
ncbi:MAG TPA: hypothetical protein VNL73_00075 [Verrucomicrobiae bacterium]|nr:hypothetical protein [Verrucomicrobiae bacterium]